SNVFPNTADPFTSFVSAVIVLGVQTLLEQRREDPNAKLDPSAIAALLNDTRFYAGVIGSRSGARARKGAGLGASKLVRWIAPKTVETIAKNQAAQVLGKLAGGLTYLFSVVGGYEYFSQFWMMAIADEPEI